MVEDMLNRWPPHGPQELISNPSLVTDDTQMTLAVGEALLEVEDYDKISAEILEKILRDHFVKWLNSPDNNRAPGMTCMRACEMLEAGYSWTKATVANSKGCGANMRVAPVGLLPEAKNGITEKIRSAIAQFQSALTHGH